MDNIKTILLIILVSVAAIVGYFILQRNSEDTNQAKLDTNQNLADLAPRTNDEGEVSVEVTPIDFSFGKPMRFEIVFDTHQGDLDFNLTQRSVLIDDLGNIYLPLEWQGGRGGHHLSGTLIFPPPKEEIKQFKLIIENIYEVGERVFKWNLEWINPSTSLRPFEALRSPQALEEVNPELAEWIDF